MSAPLAENCSAMVLAAGYGTRLEALTARRAKAVVPFLNRPLLDYTLDWLRRCGFAEAVINLHYFPETVQHQYRNDSFGLDLHYSVEDPILGTGGGPRAVLGRLGNRVLIVNGDVATTMSPGPLWGHHRDRGALATLALHAGAGADPYPGIEIDGDGRVVHIPGIDVTSSRGPAAGCFSGIHIVERDVIELVPENVFCGIVDPIYARLLGEDLPLHAVVVPGAWYEIGTPERYLNCQLEALRREDFPLAFEGYRRMAPCGHVRGLVGWERAGMRPPYLLDRGVQLEKGSLIDGVIAGRRVHFGCGATVKDCVILERASIGAGARLERCTVMEDVVVPAGAHFVDQLVTADLVGQPS